jgi:hypothetical protein
VTRWLRLALFVAGTACASGSAKDGPGSGGVANAAGSGGVANAAGSGGVANTAGSGGVAVAGDAGMPAAAGSGIPSSGAGGKSEGSAGAAGGSGTAGDGGSSGTSGAAGQGGGAGGTAPDTCSETPAPRVPSGTVVELPVELALDGDPLLFAEANPVPGGGTLTPLGVRFYVSEVALLREGADPLPVDIVTSTGTIAPYGIHFFNAEDASSTTLRLLAPSGEYKGMTFLWGLAQPCNTLRPEASSEPLSATSGMTWPHTGYLFFRYEGRTMFPGQGVAGASGAGGAGAGSAGFGSAGVGSGGAGSGGSGNPSALYPAVIHMGGSLFEPLAPSVRVEGVLSVPAAGPVQKGLRVAMDEIFAGALAEVDLTDFAGPPGEEVLRGERLRRSVPELTIFSFAP